MEKEKEIKPGDLVRLHSSNGTKAVKDWGIGIFIGPCPRRWTWSVYAPSARPNKVYWLGGRYPGFQGFNARYNLEKVS